MCTSISVGNIWHLTFHILHTICSTCRSPCRFAVRDLDTVFCSQGEDSSEQGTPWLLIPSRSRVNLYMKKSFPGACSTSSISVHWKHSHAVVAKWKQRDERHMPYCPLKGCLFFLFLCLCIFASQWTLPRMSWGRVTSSLYVGRMAVAVDCGI